jgi:DNA polymerase III delta prime subunit
MICNKNEPLWVERYRPQKIEDCILPQAIKNQFTNILKTEHIPNMILSGGAGTGKTTVAKAVCSEMKVDWIVINCSDETGIDTLRTKIKDFASTVSFSDSGKCVILDEADGMSDALQRGLRHAIEAYSKTCTFILTCNYPNRLIDALFSRSVHIPFEISKEEMPKLQAQFFGRVTEILKHENIKFDQRAVIGLITKFFPDNRRILGQLQQYARAGEIDAGILVDLQEVSIEQLIKAMKAKSFKEVRQWCADNAGNDLSNLYTKLYRNLKDHVVPDSIPEAILILEDYQRFDSVVPDKELHISALCVNLMLQINFK